MTKQDTKKQIENIEEQIKKLKEKQKRILTNSQKEIGKYLMTKWEVDNVKEAKLLIDSFIEQVKTLNEAAPSTEEVSDEKAPSLNQSKG